VPPSAFADASELSRDFKLKRPVVMMLCELSIYALVFPDRVETATAPAMVTAPSLVSALLSFRAFSVFVAPLIHSPLLMWIFADVVIVSSFLVWMEMLPAFSTDAFSLRYASVSPVTVVTATLPPAAVEPPAVPSATVVTVLVFCAFIFISPPALNADESVTLTAADPLTIEVATAASADTDPFMDASERAVVSTIDDAFIDILPVAASRDAPVIETIASDVTVISATSTGSLNSRDASAVTPDSAIIFI
jgi:hypothetical protein